MWAGIQACPPRAAASGAGQSTTVRSCDWRNSAQAPLRLKGPGMWQGPSLCAWDGVFRIARAGGVCIRKGFESASKQAHSKRFANSKAPWEVAAACRRFVSGAELDPGHPTTELDGRLPRRLAVLDLRFGGRRFPSPPAFGATSSTRFWVCPWPTRTACARSSVRGRALLSGGFSRPPQLGAQSPCPKPLTRPGCGPGAEPARAALRGCPRRPAR